MGKLSDFSLLQVRKTCLYNLVLVVFSRLVTQRTIKRAVPMGNGLSGTPLDAVK